MQVVSSTSGIRSVSRRACFVRVYVGGGGGGGGDDNGGVDVDGDVAVMRLHRCQHRYLDTQ
jgi:hypothetical protein